MLGGLLHRDHAIQVCRQKRRQCMHKAVLLHRNADSLEGFAHERVLAVLVRMRRERLRRAAQYGVQLFLAEGFYDVVERTKHQSFPCVLKLAVGADQNDRRLYPASAQLAQ